MRDQIGTTEAARRLKVSRRRVVQFIEAGRLRATKIGRTWVLDAAEVERFKAKPTGRPRKSRGR